MVQDIEGLEPELQVSLLGKTKVLQRGKVDVEDSRTGDNVPSQVSPRAGGLHSERLKVEPLAGRRVAELRAHAGCVGTIVAVARVGLVLSCDHAQGKSGGHRPNAAHLPAADQRARETVV